MTIEEIKQLIKEEGNEHEFQESGLNCKLKRNLNSLAWCGYVQVHKDSKLVGKNYYYYAEENPEITISKLAKQINNIQVHGGLTFSGQFKKKGEWWFGFDCAHCDDMIIFNKESFSLDGTYRTKEYVIKECKKLAKQLIKIK